MVEAFNSGTKSSLSGIHPVYVSPLFFSATSISSQDKVAVDGESTPRLFCFLPKSMLNILSLIAIIALLL